MPDQTTFATRRTSDHDCATDTICCSNCQTHDGCSCSTADHEHVYDDRWYPEDRHTVRRVCVISGCTETQRKQPKA